MVVSWGRGMAPFFIGENMTPKVDTPMECGCGKTKTPPFCDGSHNQDLDKTDGFNIELEVEPEEKSITITKTWKF